MANGKESSVERVINDMIEESRRIFRSNLVPTIKDLTKSAKSGLEELVKKIDRLEDKIDELNSRSEEVCEEEAAAKPKAARSRKPKK